MEPRAISPGGPGTLEPTDTYRIPSRRRAAVVGACVVLVVGTLGAFGSSTGAQSVPAPIEPVSVIADGSEPIATEHGNAAVSDTGAVVALDAATAPDGNDRRVWVRDRAAGTTMRVAEQRSSAPGISGNGCVVAYTAVSGELTDAVTSLLVADRCSAPDASTLPPGVVVDTIPSVGVPSAPAVSFDGSVIVWSTGAEIRRYVSDVESGSYVLTQAFDTQVLDLASNAVDEVVTGAALDISADGATVAFIAGPGTAYAPEPGNVYVWTLDVAPGAEPIELVSPTAAGAPSAASAASPSLSADGAVLVFESSGSDLAAVAEAPVSASFVVLVDRVQRTTSVLVDDAGSPAVSADGAHVAYVRGDAVRLLSGGVADEPASAVDRAIAGLENVQPQGPLSLSRFGRWVVFAAGDGAAVTDDIALQAGVMVWAADLRPSTDGSVVDSTTTTTTTQPTTPTTSPTPTTSTTTTSTTQPTTTTTTTTESAAGATTTTIPGNFVVPPLGAPVPLPTIPVVAPRPTRVPTTPRSTPRSTTRSTTPPGGSFEPPVAAPVVQPQTVTFAPAIVDAGRTTAVVTLTNPGTVSVQPATVRLDPPTATPFAVVVDACSGASLAPGASCSVDLSFAPVGIGSFSGLLSFDLTDGSTVSASLVGEGTAEPILTPVPAVAAAGQVVTVFGSGFPAGAVVELTRGAAPDGEQVTVDPDGSFAHVFVIMPRTSSGPLTMTVAGQVDLFADVTAEVLVSDRSSGSDAVVFRDSVSSPFGR